MKEVELLNKLESYIKDYGCGNGTLELLDELRDNLNILNNKCCGNCKYLSEECDEDGEWLCEARYKSVELDFCCREYELR